MACSAVAGAAIAVLFSPVPALADPGVSPGVVIGVPDSGTRPVPLGSLVLPGQTTPISSPVTPLAGMASSPILQKIQKGRDEIAALGDQLIRLGQDRDAALAQRTAADQQYVQAGTALQQAETEAADAAASDVFEAAALPPGVADPGLLGLNDLARIQRGEGASSESAARRLEVAQASARVALDARTEADTHYTDLIDQYTRLNAELTRKQAAQQQLERDHAPELAAAEARQTAADSRLGAEYLAGAPAGRGADPRAVQALQFALAQRGKPYVWGTEGLATYDCSGLMWRSYQTVGFQLARVARDQYWQTHDKVVDRYSLLPGDMLFFSYTNSWTGIHHVAMYAGDGMMVEAPRTGLDVRLVPVRWTELFQATRVFGSVAGATPAPKPGTPDPQPTETLPPTKPPTTKPTTAPTTAPSHPSTPPTPSTSPSPSTSPEPSPNPPPTTASPTPTASGDAEPTGSGTNSEPTSSGTKAEPTSSGTKAEPSSSGTKVEPSGAASGSSVAAASRSTSSAGAN